MIEFSYSADGKRYCKKVTSGGNTVYTYYQYDSKGNVVLETDEAQTVKVKYIRDCNGKAYAMQQNGSMYYYLYNAHGDVTSLTDSSGNSVATYTYDEFGNLKSSTGSIYNPLRYSGANNAYYDTETSLYKMGVRYYNSEVGRWITRDDYEGEQEQPQSKNRYVYCEDNPVTKVDASGSWAEEFHYDATKGWAEQVGYHHDNAEIIAKGNIDTDHMAKYHHGNGYYHFSYGFAQNRTWASYLKCYEDAKKLSKSNRRSSLRALGHALHFLQDNYCYTHSHKRYRTKKVRNMHHSYGFQTVRKYGDYNYGDKEKHHPWYNAKNKYPKKSFETEREYNNRISHNMKGWVPRRWNNSRTKSKALLLDYKNRHW